MYVKLSLPLKNSFKLYHNYFLKLILVCRIEKNDEIKVNLPIDSLL